jgi:hypothetical protein
LARKEGFKNFAGRHDRLRVETRRQFRKPAGFGDHEFLNGDRLGRQSQIAIFGKQPFQRRREIAPARLFIDRQFESRDPVGHRCLEEIGLGGNQPVERFLGNAGAFGDVVDRGAGIAMRHEFAPRRLGDEMARLVVAPGRGASARPFADRLDVAHANFFLTRS